MLSKKALLEPCCHGSARCVHAVVCKCVQHSDPHRCLTHSGVAAFAELKKQ